MFARFGRIRMISVFALVLCFGIALGAFVPFAPTRVQGQTSVDAQSQALIDLYQKVNPSVVNIQVRIPGSTSTSRTPRIQPLNPNNPNFGGPSQVEGSGFLYDNAGHIVTNAHVVQGGDLIVVTLSDDKQMEAKVVGIDQDADLAVISVDQASVSGLTPLPLADSDKVQVGERVIAIGSPFQEVGSMSQGIVSGLNRSVASLRQTTTQQNGSFDIPQVIQTDAAINPGNSGGPLLNLNGEVIGVNSQIASSGAVDQSSGVGFSIPSNLVKIVADALIKDGKIEHSYMGVSIGSLDLEINRELKLSDDLRGALVDSVEKGSPADRAGLKATGYDNNGNIILTGDIITAIDGVPVKSSTDLITYLFMKTTPGQTVKLTVLRDGQSSDISVKLVARPAIG